MGNCQSCGMPMTKPEDYGGGQPGNTYCKYCTDDQGKLLPKEEVREKMVQFQMQSLNKTRQQAETDVDKHMSLMPAWKVGVGEPLPSKPPVQPGPPPYSSQPSGMAVPKPPMARPGEPPMTKPTPKPEPVKEEVGPRLGGFTVTPPSEPDEVIPDKPPVKPGIAPVGPTPPLVKPSPSPFKPSDVSGPRPTSGLGAPPAAKPTLRPEPSGPTVSHGLQPEDVGSGKPSVPPGPKSTGPGGMETPKQPAESPRTGGRAFD